MIKRIREPEQGRTIVYRKTEQPVRQSGMMDPENDRKSDALLKGGCRYGRTRVGVRCVWP